MILDHNSKRISPPPQQTARMIVYVSRDDGETWDPVPNPDVPDWLKDPDVMGEIMAGHMAQQPGGPWYRAEPVTLN